MSLFRNYLQKFDPKVCAKNKARLLKQKILEAKKRKAHKDPDLEGVLNERKQKLKEIMGQLANENSATGSHEVREISFSSAHVFVHD